MWVQFPPLRGPPDSKGRLQQPEEKHDLLQPRELSQGPWQAVWPYRMLSSLTCQFRAFVQQLCAGFFSQLLTQTPGELCTWTTVKSPLTPEGMSSLLQFLAISQAHYCYSVALHNRGWTSRLFCFMLLKGTLWLRLGKKAVLFPAKSARPVS